MNRHSSRQTWQGARRVVLTAIVGIALTGCGFLDPTDVDNPRTTDDDLAAATNPTASLLPGLRLIFADAIATAVVVTEVVSDNYSIHGTGINGILDLPAFIIPTDMNSKGRNFGTYWQPQELRAFANFVLNDIAPNDPTATAAAIQEAQYYRGMAYLLLGENFSTAPLEADAVPSTAAQLLALAVTDLAIAAATSFALPDGQDGLFAASAALARAHRLLGDAGAAQLAAQSALATDPNGLVQVLYDAVNADNSPHDYLVERELQEMQPLPRLDFLDPKYTEEESGIAVAKAEEMHLILAEIQFAAGDFMTGRGHLVDAINMATARGTTPFVANDARLNADGTERPHSAVIDIAAESGSPFVSGLVLERTLGLGINTPDVSATSLDPAVVGALDPTTEQAELLHALWLARQEILFLEGRRMSDLGIRLPMMDDEVNTNINIDAGDPGTEPVVPSWIPADNAMDLFTPASPYDAVGVLITTQVTIDIDMNRVLADNFAAASPF